MPHSISGTGQSQASLAGALDALWEKFLPEIEQRVAQLETAAAALDTGDLRPEQQEEAHSAAHKLAGTLGTFGLTRGTELARELELMYSSKLALGSAVAARALQIVRELRTIVASRKGMSSGLVGP
jgi:HPt (histidine-containing phosphotransfer) domain-containing protein